MKEIILRPDMYDYEIAHLYIPWSETQDNYIGTLHIDFIKDTFGEDVGHEFYTLSDTERDELTLRIDAEVI